MESKAPKFVPIKTHSSIKPGAGPEIPGTLASGDGQVYVCLQHMLPMPVYSIYTR